MQSVTMQRIATIFEDVFGIPASRVEPGDTLDVDWGLVGKDRVIFDREFCAEFGVDTTGREKTVEDYARLVS